MFEPMSRRTVLKGLGTAVALDEVTEGVTTLGGPSLGGLLFSLGRALPFLADAISYAVSIVTLLLVRAPLQGNLRSATLPERRSLLGEGAGAFQRIRRGNDRR